MSSTENKQIKKVKILISVLVILCILGLLGLFISSNQKDLEKESTGSTVSFAPSSNIQGVVIELSSDFLTLQDIHDTPYTFNIKNMKNTSKLNIGQLISVTYQGELSESLSTQETIITDILIKDQLEKQAFMILKDMTLEEKVGQLFIGRCPNEEAVSKLMQYHLSGYILFKPDFENKSKEEIIQTIQSYQEASSIPLLIGVDEEGGSVNRISLNNNLRSEPFQSPQELYQEGGFELIQNDTQEKCELLSSLGININFAPVCDLSTNPEDYIYKRSFGQDAQSTATYISTVTTIMKRQKIGSVLKHFPGYGNNEDTHTGIVYDHRSYETFLTADFIPFQAGIQAGADAILVSHNIVSCFDNQYPSSLSPTIHQIIREELGFNGVIITDDLAMDGVSNFASDSKVAIMAVQAGNDLLCCTDFEIQIPAIIQAVKNGTISEERVNESVLRVLKLKITLDIIPKNF